LSKTIDRPKILGRTDMVLFTVSAILLLETLAAAASIGSSSIFWWLFLGVVFFIPFAMICAEMGCTYPEQGGIYAWIRDAFGGRWASRASWCYWVNTTVWIPAIFILFAGVFRQLFYPDLSMSAQIAMGVILIWLTVGVNVVTLDIGKWIPNIGAILKVLVFIAVILGAISYNNEFGLANVITLETLQPNWSSGVQYIPAIVYGMLGFELVSAGSEEMKNPASDVPRSIFISGFIIIVLYTAATVAVLAALPAGEIDLVEGLIDTLNSFFGATVGGRFLVLLLGICALYTFFSNGVTWALGCNRAAAEAAIEGEFPAVFAIESPTRGTPVGAAVAMGVFSTGVLLLYGFLAKSNEDLFWSLFAFSAVIFLLPYLGMLSAFIKSRTFDAHRMRPYAVPGGYVVATVCAIVCMSTLSLSIVFFMYTPGEGVQWPVVIGASLMIAIGEVLIRMAERKRRIAAVSAQLAGTL
jgi:amino acid transporter